MSQCQSFSSSREKTMSHFSLRISRDRDSGQGLVAGTEMSSSLVVSPRLTLFASQRNIIIILLLVILGLATIAFACFTPAFGMQVFVFVFTRGKILVINSNFKWGKTYMLCIAEVSCWRRLRKIWGWSYSHHHQHHPHHHWHNHQHAEHCVHHWRKASETWVTEWGYHLFGQLCSAKFFPQACWDTSLTDFFCDWVFWILSKIHQICNCGWDNQRRLIIIRFVTNKNQY